MTILDRLQRKPAALVPALVGLGTVLLTGTHVLSGEESASGMAISLGVLAILCVPLVVGTAWLVWRPFTPGEVRHVVGWALAGAVPITLLATVLVFYQRAHGVALAHPVIVTSWVTGVGTIGGFLTGLYDVRRVRRHERYEETSKRLRALIEASPVAIVTIDSDGIVTDWSQAATEMFGWEREEIVGEQYPLVPEECHTEFDDHLRQVNAGQTLSGVETERQCRDGSTIDVSIWSSPIERDDVVEEHMIALVDISERKAKQRELKLLSRAIEQADDAVIITDDDGVIEYVNDAFTDLFGFEREQVLGRTPRLLKSGEHDQSFYAELWETITDGEVFQAEVTNRHHNGELLDVELTIAPVQDDGVVTHYVAIERDVTDRKRDRQRLEVLNRVLRHNVRNALTVIDSNACRLRETCTDSESRVMVDSIADRTDELQSAVDKARTVQRALDTERTSALDVRRLLSGQRTVALDRYPTADISVDAAPDLWVTGNHTLDAALGEAIDNAIEHGGADQSVELTATERGEDFVELRIADDGPGVPDHERRVLESGEESALEHGSGLGLWVMHWVVTSCGGDVTIADRENGGAVVTFTLPRATAPDPTPARERGPSHRPSH